MKAAVQVPLIGVPEPDEAETPKLTVPVNVPFPPREEVSVPDQSACTVKALLTDVPVKFLMVPDTAWPLRVPIHVAVALIG